MPAFDISPTAVKLNGGLLLRLLTPLLILCPLVLPAAAQPAAGGNAQTPQVRALAGRPVESVRIMGNRQVSTAVIRNAIRTAETEPFDPELVREDYQRIFDLRAFANVEARIEPTDTGVIVIFIVTEQQTITSIAFRGNRAIATAALLEAIDLRPGHAIDPFRIAMARQAIVALYRDRNRPHARADVSMEHLTATGELLFEIIEGPSVRIRAIQFDGNDTLADWQLMRQVRSRHWRFIIRPGTFDPDQLQEDVASIRRFYHRKGFFEARVGRRITVSPDKSEMMITFLIDEGPRYTIDRVIFRGNATLAEAELRQDLALLEGAIFDADRLDRDIRRIVRAYSPYGFIYDPRGVNPDYLHIDARPVFREEPGRVNLFYQIDEGRPFQLGAIHLVGNQRTQDRVVLRELGRLGIVPGRLYDSAQVREAADHLLATPFFTEVNITPIGEQEHSRDLLIELAEGNTASFRIGAGISSAGGVGGNITFEQRNFDIANWPADFDELISGRAFLGAGQVFRVSLEPGTRFTNASILFSEPWLLDQPYSLTLEAYLRNRLREHYDERRLGGRATLGHWFTPRWHGDVTFRGEDILITRIRSPEIRSPQILAHRGHSTLSSVELRVMRDTTNRGPLAYRGSRAEARWESAGALGGDFTFQKFILGWDWYQTLGEDLLERRVVLSLGADAGYIAGNAPFFERFYGGGIGGTTPVRGFRFRGITPRDGIARDRIGGDFMLAGSAEVSFPLAGDNLRGVLFTDIGTVEPDHRISTIRWSAGAGLRMMIPVLGDVPFAIDFAVPLNRGREDDTQLISFSLGLIP